MRLYCIMPHLGRQYASSRPALSTDGAHREKRQVLAEADGSGVTVSAVNEACPTHLRQRGNLSPQGAPWPALASLARVELLPRSRGMNNRERREERHTPS